MTYVPFAKVQCSPREMRYVQYVASSCLITMSPSLDGSRNLILVFLVTKLSNTSHEGHRLQRMAGKQKVHDCEVGAGSRGSHIVPSLRLVGDPPFDEFHGHGRHSKKGPGLGLM